MSAKPHSCVPSLLVRGEIGPRNSSIERSSRGEVPGKECKGEPGEGCVSGCQDEAAVSFSNGVEKSSKIRDEKHLLALAEQWTLLQADWGEQRERKWRQHWRNLSLKDGKIDVARGRVSFREKKVLQ